MHASVTDTRNSIAYQVIEPLGRKGFSAAHLKTSVAHCQLWLMPLGSISRSGFLSSCPLSAEWSCPAHDIPYSEICRLVDHPQAIKHRGRKKTRRDKAAYYLVEKGNALTMPLRFCCDMPPLDPLLPTPIGLSLDRCCAMEAFPPLLPFIVGLGFKLPPTEGACPDILDSSS